VRVAAWSPIRCQLMRSQLTHRMMFASGDAFSGQQSI
jgi:hypothetical protein